MKDTESLYLQKLQFDPRLKRGFMAVLIRKVRVVMLAILSLIIAGGLAFATLPRELNPEVEIPIVNIVTTLPGASPADVEQLITTEIEQTVNNITGIDTLTSSSTNSLSVVTIQFVASEDIDEVLQKVKDQVDLIVADLPEDANEPTVAKLDFNQQPVMTVALTGDVNRLSLANIADEVQNKLEATSDISRVSLSGQTEEEIIVQLDPESLLTYQLTPAAVSGVLQSNNLTFPAGSITIGQTEYTLSINNQFSDIEAVRNQLINVGDQTVTLGTIADVYYRAQPSDSLVYARLNKDSRNPAIQLSVFKSENSAIADTASTALEVIKTELQQYPDIHYVEVLNLAQDIEQQFVDLSSNFRSTILLVFLILFIFLGLRQASVASISIPLTFLSAFIIMNALGVSINFLSMFSLLLALGLVVDDAIVIVQAANKYGKKFKPDEAALLVYRDFVVPIWTTTLTTVWAFLPLLLASGIIGAFIRSIPIVVSATLISSTTIAVLLNIPLTVIFAHLNKIPNRVRLSLWLVGIVVGAGFIWSLSQGSPLAPVTLISYFVTLVSIYLARKRLRRWLQQHKPHLNSRLSRLPKSWRSLLSKNSLEQGLVNFDQFANSYKGFLDTSIDKVNRRRSIYVLTGLFLVVSGVFLATGLLKNEFFPASDSENIYINVVAPVGWPVEKTDQVLIEVEDLIIDTPEIRSVISETGNTFDTSGAGVASSGPHTGYISVTLSETDQRQRTSIELADTFRQQVASITQAEVTVAELSGGPPAGADFQVNIKGESLENLEKISNDFMAILESIEGAANIDTTLKQSAGEIRVNLIDQAMAQRGLSAAQVGGFLRSALSGDTSNSLQMEGSDQDIIITLNQKDTPIEQIQSLIIPGPRGNYTLSEIATFTLETSPQSIVREDETRVVRVLAAATEGVASTEILAQFQAKVADYDMPAGYTWDVGGANEENQRSVNSIIQAMGVSAILILVTMVLQLESFRKSALVLTVIPLAIAGVFFNFTLFRIPLSFPALIGVLALFGIVVNNSIMLVEKINQNLQAGFNLKEAITDACSTRIEPILLTSLTTSAGLLPITISDPLWRGLGGAIIAGLSVSGILILVVLPTLYYEVYKNDPQHK